MSGAIIFPRGKTNPAKPSKCIKVASEFSEVGGGGREEFDSIMVAVRSHANIVNGKNRGGLPDKNELSSFLEAGERKYPQFFFPVYDSSLSSPVPAQSRA
jgi:hypothetical protein